LKTKSGERTDLSRAGHAVVGCGLQPFSIIARTLIVKNDLRFDFVYAAIRSYDLINPPRCSLQTISSSVTVSNSGGGSVEQGGKWSRELCARRVAGKEVIRRPRRAMFNTPHVCNEPPRRVPLAGLSSSAIAGGCSVSN